MVGCDGKYPKATVRVTKDMFFVYLLICEEELIDMKQEEVGWAIQMFSANLPD